MSDAVARIEQELVPLAVDTLIAVARTAEARIEAVIKI